MTAAGEIASELISDEFASTWPHLYCEAWNSHDPNEMVKLANEDVYWEDPGIYPDRVRKNRNFLADWVRHLLQAVPDLEVKGLGEPLVALDRSRVVFEWAMTGTMTGPLDPPGFGPTGRMFTVTGFDSHWFRDGKLARVLTVADVASFAEQICAAPRPGSLTERLGVELQRMKARRIRRRKEGP
jgi:steroid delta-isomerase-like uncharacterized protein